MKILVVEDQLKIADYLYKGLTEQGCSVDLAHDGLDGQHLALEVDYDVIVLDQMLPARDRIEDRVKGLRAGADDYLVKPFSFMELLARLQALTRRGLKLEATE